MKPYLTLAIILFLLFLFISIPAKASVQVVASNTLRVSNDTQVDSGATGAWNLVKIIGNGSSSSLLENTTGSYNVSITIWDDGLHYPFQIEKNGILLSGASGTTTSSAVIYNYTINTNFTFTNDTLELWVNQAVGNGLHFKNFQMLYDFKYPDPPENDTAHIYSNYTSWPLGQTYTGSSVTVDIIPRVNKTSPYDLFNLSGLIGRWHFDDNLTDVSGRNHNGTLVSNTTASYQLGELNNATYLNTKAYINTSNVTDYAFNYTDPFTMILWIKYSSLNGGFAILLANVNPSVIGYQWYFDATAFKGDTLFTLFATSGSRQIRINNSLMNDSMWHQLAITYNGNNSDSGFTYYIDAIQKPIITYGATTTGTAKSSKPLLIGSRPYDYGLNFTGLIDEVQVYNRSLNRSEINSTYFVKPSNLQVKTNSGVEDWQGNWNNYNASGGDNPINIATGGSFNSLSISVPSSYNQSGVNVSDFQRLAYFNITATATASNVSYISPTKINSSEVWGVNTTTIKIQGLKNIANAILYWQPTRGRESNVVTYPMNSENSTIFSYNFTNLNDGDYPYYVLVNFSDGTNITMPSYYATIDFDLDQTFTDAYLFYNNSNGAYSTNTTYSWLGYTFVEPEWRGWSSTTHPSSLLYRCDNATGYGVGLQTYDDTGGCAAGYTQTALAYTLNSWNPYTVQLKRYVNASHYITTYNDPPAGYGYAFQKNLGWVMQMSAQNANIVYLNNSKIKIGVDTKYGGMIVYLAEMNNLSKNLLNIYDAQGRAVQTAYYDDVNHCTNQWNWSCDVYSSSYSWGQAFGWNPTLAGNQYGQSSNVSSYSIDSTNKTISIIVDKVAQWNPAYNNGLYSDLAMNVTYSFDGENPVVISNFTYTHYGIVTHPAYTQESPTVYGIKEFTHAWYKNATVQYEDTPMYQGTSVYYSANHDMVYVAMTNSSNYGVGIWNYRRPQVSFSNFSLDSVDGTPYSHASNKIDVWPSITFNKTGESGSSGSNIGRMYVGSLSAMDTYFTGLEFSIAFDPSTPINQTVANQDYIYVQVNATNTAQIQNATMNWTNITGSHFIAMTISALKDYAYMNMTGLVIPYNYTYSVTSNATTGAKASIGTTWTNLTDTTPPSSITNLANTAGTNYINWTWTDPADSDFAHVYLLWGNKTWLQNVSKGLQNLNLSWLPHTTYNISAQTIDTSGNMNASLIWLNATNPNNAPVLTQPTNQTVNESEKVLITFNASDIDNDVRTYSINRTDLFTDFNASTGKGNWTTNFSSGGIYYIDAGVTDGYGGQDNKTFTITVKDVPRIIQTWNSINGYNKTALTLNVGNSINSIVTGDSQYPILNWSWKVDGVEQQNTSDYNYSKLFNTLGSYNLTIQGFNNNGTTGINYTVITVQTSGGGGTTYDWLDGYVKDSLTNPIGGASVQTSQGSSTTAGNGYYSFGYVFVQGNTYLINFSKAGYNNNNQSLLFTTDHMVLNVTLSQISPSSGFNVSGYVLNQTNMSVLSGAVISSPGLISNTSNSSGFWIINNVTNGTKTFTASLAGYTDNFTVTTISGEDLSNQNITLIPVLTPTPTLSGNITTAQVQALIDANNTTVFLYGLIGGIIGCYAVSKRRRDD